MRLSVTHWRILIVAVNFLLTVSVAGHVVYRWQTPYHEEDKILIRLLEDTEEKDFLPSEKNPNRSKSGVDKIRQVAGVGRALDPVENPPPPPPPPPPGPEDDPDTLVQGEDEVNYEGPLTGKWEYHSFIYFGPGDERNRAFLQKAEQESPTASRRTTPIRRSSISRRRIPSRSSVLSRRRAAFNKDEQRVLFLYGHMPLEEDDDDPESREVAWITDITPEHVIYEVQSQNWARFALPLEEDTIYRDGKVTPEKPEDEEEEDGEKKKLFVLDADMPSRQQDYISIRGGGPSLRPRSTNLGRPKPTTPTTPGSTNDASNSSTPANEPKTAEEKKEEARKALETLQKIDKSKLTPKQRQEMEKINEILGGAGS